MPPRASDEDRSPTASRQVAAWLAWLHRVIVASMNPRPTWTSLCLALTFLAIATLFFGCFAEDAFIVARYAANLAAGNGLVYNAGERVSALTSPPHALVLALFEGMLGRSVGPYAALCAAALALFIGLNGGDRIFPDARRGAWFAALALAFPPLAFWMVGGLETPLLVFLSLGFLLAWRRYARDESVTAASALAVLAALAAWVRLDSAPLFAPAVLWVARRARRAPAFWIGAVAAALPLAGWLLFASRYYGDPLPTSFYVKNPIATSAGEITKGIAYEASLVALLGAPFLAASLAGRRGAVAVKAAPASEWLPLALGLALYALYGLGSGTKHMMYLYRVFVPAVPLAVFVFLSLVRSVPRPVWLVSVAAIQIGLATVVYYRSINLNLISPLIDGHTGQETFEFARLGAIYDLQSIRALAAQAPKLRAHWATQKAGDGRTQPRLFSTTGGQPAYHLRDYYVIESLVSYRHHCDLARYVDSAHYRQHITLLSARDGEVAAPGPPWRLVIRDDIPVIDWSGRPLWLRLSWYYQPSPREQLPSSRIDRRCR
jgi:arabinofuranosyltransferase